MKRGLLTTFAVALACAMVGMFAVASVAQEDAPRITKEELKGMLDSADVIIVDVRLGTDWKASEVKIVGAVREDPKKVKPSADKYPKDKTLVFY